MSGDILVVGPANPRTEILFVPEDDPAAWHAARKQDMTASVAGSLLGVHEYTTVYEQWALKTGRITADPEETAPMRRGRLLEPVAVQILREERPDWKIEYNAGRDRVYLRNAGDRLGATPDVFAYDPDRGRGIVQIKTVEGSIFSRKWRRSPDPTDISPPLWIAVQALIEAELAGVQWVDVAPLVVGFGINMQLVNIPFQPKVIARIREENEKFWAMVEAGTQPDPDYARDGEVLAALYEAEDGSEVDLSGDDAVTAAMSAYDQMKRVNKANDKAIEETRALIRHKMGNASVARLVDGRVITWRVQHKKQFTVQASSNRVLRFPTARTEE